MAIHRNGLNFLRWDTDTAAGAVVLGSLFFLWSVRKGFRGLT